MIPIIGHRGWRGKYPENSLLGFEQLALSNIQAVELDIVVSKDNELIISHEPWFDSQYCLSDKKSNLYQLSLEEIQAVDCGSKIDDRFPKQVKTKTVKPTFKALIDLWSSLGVKPFIALEVKSEAHLYGNFQSFPDAFADLLIDFEKKYLKGYNYFVQSFDPYFLKVYHEKYPETKTGLLVENKLSVEENLSLLGYTPDFYNPEHILLSPELIEKLKAKNIDTYTWTVNTPNDFNKIKDLDLAGIITDYPLEFMKWV